MDTNEWIHDERTGGAIFGLLAGINIVVEALVDKGFIDPSTVATLLQAKIQQLQQDTSPQTQDAADMLQNMLAPLVSTDRQAVRLLRDAEPGGRA